MEKGFDYIGLTVSFYCHDGAGNYVIHQRSDKCRDEHGTWDFGGGGIKFGETIEDALLREIKEEYGTEPLELEFLGFGDNFRTISGRKSHWIGFRYRVLLDRDKVINGEPEKHTELRWVTMDDLPTPLHSMVPAELEEYQHQLV